MVRFCTYSENIVSLVNKVQSVKEKKEPSLKFGPEQLEKCIYN
jgi:hypothetical protein